MREVEFPFVVTEDGEVIARFRRLSDAARFASYHAWGDFHHNVTLIKTPTVLLPREPTTRSS